MDMNSYERRMMAKNKNFFHNTVTFLDKNFHLSPFYQHILFENRQLEAIVNDGKSVDEKTILLRPNSQINKGEILEYDHHLWLVMNFNQDVTYPTLKIKLCNQRLKSLKDGSEIPVVAVGKKADLNEDKEYLIVTTNEIAVLSSYQKSKHIKLQDKFTINKRGYKIIGIDDVTDVYRDTGIVKFTLEVTDLPIIDTTPPSIPVTTPTPSSPVNTGNAGTNNNNETGGWGDWS